MLRLFTDLNDQIVRIKDEDLHVPEGKMGDGDTLIATLDDPELKRLFTLQQTLKRDSMLASVHAATGGEAMRRDHSRAAVEMDSKSDLARAAFWAALKDKYHLWGEEAIGLREGWRIVRMDTSKQSAAALDALMGMLAR